MVLLAKQHGNEAATPGKITLEPAFVVSAVLVTLGALAIFAARVCDGLTLAQFDDESKNFVAAQMINHGMRLYRDIFEHHGPLETMLAHLYSVIVSATDFSWVRLIVAVLAVLAALSVAASPLLSNRAARLVAAALFFAFLASLWTVQSIHMLLYYGIAGFLFTVALAQLAAPPLFDRSPTTCGAFVSGTSITLACFAAYTFGLAAITVVCSCLLALAASGGDAKMIRRLAISFAAGVCVAVAGVAVWLYLYGDFIGYFIYHFYFNQTVYIPFTGYSPMSIFSGIVLSGKPADVIQSLGIVAFLLDFAVLVVTVRASHLHRNWMKLLSIVLLAGGLLMLNPRGVTTFQNTPFLIAVLGLLALNLGSLVGLAIERRQFLLGGAAFVAALIAALAVEAEARTAITSPHGVPRAQLGRAVMGIAEFEPFNLIRSYAREGEPILVLIYAPSVYFHSGRLPASGNFYYLPWQAAYARMPLANYHIDICEDLRKARPPVVWFDNWKVWDVYSIQDYEPCVPAFLAENYSQLSGYPYVFVRRDRMDSPR